MNQAVVIWFTGLSGSGKTTISEGLKIELESLNKTVRVIDGDDVRNTIHKHLGFSPEDIKENNRLILDICIKNLFNFDFILVPIISPFKESRQFAREKLNNQFIELFCNCSLEECIKRDVKGLYKKALAGEIKNFIGIAKENPYEPPEKTEIIINTEIEQPQESVNTIVSYLRKNKFL